MSESSLNIQWIEVAAIEVNPKVELKRQALKRAIADQGVLERLQGFLPERWQKAKPVVVAPDVEEHIPPQRIRFGVLVRVDTMDFDSLKPFELDPGQYSKEGGDHLQDTQYVKGVIRYHRGDELYEETFVFPVSNPNPAIESYTAYNSIHDLRPT